MRDLTLAIYQMDVITGKKDKNLAKITQLLANYTESIDLLVVPELFTTGFCYDKFDVLAEEKNNSETINSLEKLSQEYSIGIAGSILMVHKHNKKMASKKALNIGFIIEPAKGAIYSYQKVNLWNQEKKHFIPGNILPEPVNFMNKATIGLLICYDLRFPEMYRKLALNGADIILTTAAWPSARVQHFNLLAAARALENTCYHLVVNRIGREETTATTTLYPGSSRIINPCGKSIIEATTKDEVISATLTEKKLQNTRQKLPVLEDWKKVIE
ncbi:MAG: nitrilase-related carbon-nitrogen hydrolase [Asgard group archaeon]|nr:nitrilase-related carbon-nitrogen hydrolase [Asgard group archaeon]